MEKEALIEFIKQKRDTANVAEKPYYAAVYFVLRNRTEENWGPKELTMDVAMRMTEFDSLPVDNNHVADGCELFIGVPRNPKGHLTAIDGGTPTA